MYMKKIMEFSKILMDFGPVKQCTITVNDGLPVTRLLWRHFCFSRYPFYVFRGIGVQNPRIQTFNDEPLH